MQFEESDLYPKYSFQYLEFFFGGYGFGIAASFLHHFVVKEKNMYVFKLFLTCFIVFIQGIHFFHMKTHNLAILSAKWIHPSRFATGIFV